MIYNINLSREIQEDKFMTYTVPEFNMGNKLLLRNCTGDVWDSTYGVVYHVIWRIEW